MTLFRPVLSSLAEFTRLMSGVFAPKRQESSAVISQVISDPATGNPIAAHFFVRGGTEAQEGVIANGQSIAVGETWDVSYGLDPADPQYRLERKRVSQEIMAGAMVDRLLPTLTVIGSYGRSGGPSAGGYSSTQLIRYLIARRGQYDLYALNAVLYAHRVRVGGASTWEAVIGPQYPQPRGSQTSALIGYLEANNTDAVPIVQNEDFPTCLPGEIIRVKIRQEIIEGRYFNNAGTWQLGDPLYGGLTRGIEAYAEEPGSYAVQHPDGTLIQLLSTDAVITGLTPGKEYDAMISCVDLNNVYGPWNETDPITFTAWEETLPPDPPLWVKVTAVPGGFEIEMPHPPIPDFKGFMVRRNFFATPAAFTTAQAEAAAGDWTTLDAKWDSGVKRISTLNAEEEVGDGLTYLWPGDKGVPLADLANPVEAKKWGYFGVKVVRDSGVASLHSTWDSDTDGPPRPDPASVTIRAVLGGVWIDIAPGEPNRAKYQRGWDGYVVWQAIRSGPGAFGFQTQMVISKADKIFVPTDPNVAGIRWQVVSIDFNFNQTDRIDDDTHWKTDTYIPPPPASVTVRAVQDGYRIDWTPAPVLGSEPKRVRGYRIWRHTSNPYPDPTPPYDYIGVPPGGATELGYEVDGPTAVFPFTVGAADAYWFAVASVPYTGQLNTGLARWAEDPDAPGVPLLSAYHWDPIAAGFHVWVDLDTETARRSLAFKEYVVIRRVSTSLYEVLGSTDGTSFVFNRVEDAHNYTRSVQRIQLLARLWSGRTSAMQSAVNSLQVRNGLPDGFTPPNGAMFLQLASGSVAYWQLTVAGDASPTAALVFDPTAGILGSSCARIDVAAGVAGNQVILHLVSMFAIPHNPAHGVGMRYSAKASINMTGGSSPALYGTVLYYDNDYGEGTEIGGIGLSGLGTAMTAGVWYEKLLDFTNSSLTYPTAKSAKVEVLITYARPSNAAHSLYVDDVQAWQY